MKLNVDSTAPIVTQLRQVCQLASRPECPENVKQLIRYLVNCRRIYSYTFFDGKLTGACPRHRGEYHLFSVTLDSGRVVNNCRQCYIEGNTHSLFTKV